MGKYKVYVIENQEEVVYVGQCSRDLEQRLYEHCNDFEKYPEKAQFFTDNKCTIREIYSSDYKYDLNIEEQYWIDYYKPADDLDKPWFNKVRAKKMSSVDKWATIKILQKQNNTIEGEFKTMNDDDLDNLLDGC